ncbi:nitroreductase [Lactobacillus sp. S2-2]|uniref:nitroreductase family protein n=1 Tax=Lactobacillus sp. S2-2 TaxID=2692917 RepID=UPI001F2E5A98|nr:nitroreductase family protein [Lactobacillus sp. S2-2]MCF6514624.1 nitroreductase [Lactobacillus sp. S2-2]
MKKELLNITKNRRSIYALGKDVKFSDDELYDYITEVIQNTPSAFNSQTVRAIVLFGESHDKLWDITADVLKERVPVDGFLRTKAKLDTFKNAYASILFFTEMDTVKNLEEKFTTYKDQFYNWSEQGQGNAQFAVWSGLEENGLGVNIQHYNPLIDTKIKEAFDVPENWKLISQMNFGSIEENAGDKDFIDKSEKFKRFD